MKAKRLREQIRDITDPLEADVWLTFTHIKVQLECVDARPKRTNLGTTIDSMVDEQQLLRKVAPPGSGRGCKWLYRSGPKPIMDNRGQHMIRNPEGYGFMRLKRLKKENRAEWDRITEFGTLV